ncbi:MAG: formimidoylglutamate deiminase [Rehaibacterium terrae]|uniref:formimidoylglutamate deiminase n=1 Tax=Rehaibacterium terrae TaxID=1341696 RepID=UPI00391C72A0
MSAHHADHAWLPQGWAADVRLQVAGDGSLCEARAGTTAATLGRWLLPGLPNTHSHAFQRAMAGLTERQGHPQDSFWTWRELMYRFAGRITPESLHAIASQLYAEMLEAGYTSVCEFHYLHHDIDGRPYADPAAMSLALVEAARETGIGLTLLPTLYLTGGFDGRPLNERQRRFGHTVESFLTLLQRLRTMQDGQLRVGLAFHSLRAVPEEAMRAVLDAVAGEDLPIHIHIAEQLAEVQDSLALRGARPVQWLLDRMPVDARWHLVHATHLTGDEVRGIAASGAGVVLCPTTEANLGDGLFPLRDYLDAGGVWSIGSDSHVSVSPVEELRWLEYGQRLVAHRRNIAVAAGQPSTGAHLFAQALAGGARAAGRAVGALAPGHRADFVVLDEHAPILAGATPDDLLDRWLFSGNRPLVREVFVGGRRVVADGRHVHADRIAERYRRVLPQLLQD